MIGIITYDVPHRKTQDLVWRLMLNGYRDIELIALPYEQRKQRTPLVQHRPLKAVKNDDIPFNCHYIKPDQLNSLLTLNDYSSVLIGGAGILEDIGNHKIINSHPGYLPNVKGLDALKWAIYLNEPIGVTTHYIDEQTDAGVIINRRVVPVYFEDTFHSVAWRLYEVELDMLVEAVDNNMVITDQPVKNHYTANKRMPAHKEAVMLQRFEEIRLNSMSMYG